MPPAGSSALQGKGISHKSLPSASPYCLHFPSPSLGSRATCPHAPHVPCSCAWAKSCPLPSLAARDGLGRWYQCRGPSNASSPWGTGAGTCLPPVPGLPQPPVTSQESCAGSPCAKWHRLCPAGAAGSALARDIPWDAREGGTRGGTWRHTQKYLCPLSAAHQTQGCALCLLPIPCSPFPAPHHLLSIPCSPFPAPHSLLPIPCSSFSVPHASTTFLLPMLCCLCLLLIPCSPCPLPMPTPHAHSPLPMPTPHFHSPCHPCSAALAEGHRSRGAGPAGLVGTMVRSVCAQGALWKPCGVTKTVAGCAMPVPWAGALRCSLGPGQVVWGQSGGLGWHWRLGEQGRQLLVPVQGWGTGWGWPGGCRPPSASSH
ncbi:uncharacterized protein LOC119711862 [Motacilla alba alba]|uniref:uncharacterized protein LOC119711862 n=1 Tax=Motacilla alba alba TaxID=1094192 RepID=UPI0018D512C2|nr:uncharacterized protein LOC119711862 [Motacilla alba alba]